jgi:hypothetical protein
MKRHKKEIAVAAGSGIGNWGSGGSDFIARRARVLGAQE